MRNGLSRRLHLVETLAIVAMLSGCVATTRTDGTDGTVDTNSSATGSSVTASDNAPTAPTTRATASSTTSTASTAPATSAEVDPAWLVDIGPTAVPADVIVPTSEATLNPERNPINGARGDGRLTNDPLTEALDVLGFAVGGDDITDGEQARRVGRAIAVVQLDAGLPTTGVADDAVRDYLGLGAGGLAAGADEQRTLGTSANGRPIVAFRYGDGPRVVMVVGQTHGDEEGGLRVVLRARTMAVADNVTLWVIPTMNPDGGAADSRFLADGTDPNRAAATMPEQQLVFDFALAVRPVLSVWYHQNYGWIGGSGASMEAAAQYQALTGLGGLMRSGDCVKGFMWCPIDEALAASSILVELPDVLTPADVQLHADALHAVAATPPTE